MAQEATVNSASEREEKQRERLLWALSAATFLIFFQAYMVAPLIPRLSSEFAVGGQRTGLIVPAYLIPYGVSTLFYGLLSDRIGRSRIVLASLGACIVLTALTATAHSASQIIFWRLLTGLGASGVIPLALALVGTLFPYQERGRPLGWLFGAMAGGAAFGSTVGVVLEPFIGWRMLFVGVAILAAVVFALLFPYRSLLGEKAAGPHLALQEVITGYKSLLASARGARTYGYVFWNGVFHSGIFTWLGVYFIQRYHLGEVGIGLALLGYGVPGFLLGAAIGRAADRYGRRWLIPVGLGIGVVSAVLLVSPVPLLLAVLAVTILSLSYDMTQPLFCRNCDRAPGEARRAGDGAKRLYAFYRPGDGELPLWGGAPLRLWDGAWRVQRGSAWSDTPRHPTLFRRKAFTC